MQTHYAYPFPQYLPVKVAPFIAIGRAVCLAGSDVAVCDSHVSASEAATELNRLYAGFDHSFLYDCFITRA